MPWSVADDGTENFWRIDHSFPVASISEQLNADRGDWSAILICRVVNGARSTVSKQDFVEGIPVPAMHISQALFTMMIVRSANVWGIHRVEEKGTAIRV